MQIYANYSTCDTQVHIKHIFPDYKATDERVLHHVVTKIKAEASKKKRANLAETLKPCDI